MRFATLGFFVFAFASAVFLQACGNQHDKADSYFREGEYDKAAKIYESIIKKQPQDIVALKGLADIKLFQKDYKAAIANYTKIVEIDPVAGAKDLTSMFSYPKNVRDIATNAVKELKNGKTEVINEIFTQMKTSSQYVKMDYLESLARIGRPASFATEEIAKYLNDDYFGIRKAALETLGNMDPNKVKETGTLAKIVKALDDENPMVSESAVISLGLLKDGANSAVPDVIEMLVNQNNDIREAAKKSLAAIGSASKEAVPALVKLTDERKTSVIRVAAVDSLAAMGNKANDAIPDLIPLLQDSDNQVKLATVSALSKIGRASNEAMPKLVQLFQSKDANIRLRAVNELSELGKAAAADKPTMSSLAYLSKNDPSKEVRDEAKNAIDKINKAIR